MTAEIATLIERRYKQKRLQSRKTENEGIQRIRSNTVRLAGLILLFAEKCPSRGADERNQTGILTWASNLIPPSRCRWLWNL